MDTRTATEAQPMPKHNGRAAIQDLVIADIQARKRIGLAKYGTLLKAFDGRDALVDLYQEQLDGCQYTRQLIEERDARPVVVLPQPRRTPWFILGLVLGFACALLIL